MARIRSIKPDFFKDEDLRKLPYVTRLFFIGLWCWADKDGRLRDSPERLKVEIMPYDDVDVEAMLKTLSNTKPKRPFILRYEQDGDKYIQILSWQRHQRPHHTEMDSLIPMPASVNTPLGNGEDTVSRCLGREGKGKEKEYKDIARQVIEYLNSKTGKEYKVASKDSFMVLSARLREGYTIDEFKKIVDNMCDRWLGDEKMEQFLRPNTLFRVSKIEGYLNADKGLHKKIKDLKEGR